MNDDVYFVSKLRKLWISQFSIQPRLFGVLRERKSPNVPYYKARFGKVMGMYCKG